jgi:hypothetical protein
MYLLELVNNFGIKWRYFVIIAKITDPAVLIRPPILESFFRII